MAKAGAKSKYTSITVAKIIAAIKETGRDCDGYRTAGISHETFHRWMREKDEFRENIEAAREYYQERSLPQLRSWAKDGLRRTLKAVSDGDEIITTTKVTGIGPDGAEVDLETVQRKPAMIPIDKAFTHVMGREFDLMRWVQEGLEEGVLPRSVAEEIINEVSGVRGRIREVLENGITKGGGSINRNPGVDPGLAIASALGLTDPVGVPNTMDTRQKPSKDMGKITADRS